MPETDRVVAPGPDDRSVRTGAGQVLRPPSDWELLAPGDAALTRRVKLGGPTWTVREPRGRKLFSRGVWAPRDRIERIRVELEGERAEPSYARKLEAGRQRRAREQVAYVDEFQVAVKAFLAFAPVYDELADRVSAAIAAHSTPVGAGTVARTKRIPVIERAESATIAWLRHQTTAYDSMHVPRVKGKRREVRRMLALRSRELLGLYRGGVAVAESSCLLRTALARQPS